MFNLANLRRLIQAAGLVLFLGLVLLTRPVPGGDPAAALKLFFWIDPLLLAATWLAAHAVPAVLLASLGTVLVTLVFGRVFCGWVCPLGTIHAAAGWLVDRVWPNRRRRDHWSPWQRAKYFLLAGLLAMALFGGHWGTIFDPLVLLYRTTATALLPGTQWAAETGSTAIYKSDPGVGPVRLKSVTEPPYRFLHDHVFVVEKQSFVDSGPIFAFFLVILLLNAYRRRWWCRYVCPLGAMLGAFSLRPLLRRATKAETCNQCDLCARSCHGAAGSSGGQTWRPAECFGCMNCTRDCRRESLRFTWALPWKKEPATAGVDVSKRALLASGVGGLVGLALMRTTPQARGTTYNPALIRPPGARPERDFLARCTACGLCMKVCPTGGLQPSFAEAGLEGLWTPRLVPQIGYCDYSCTHCGHVCPTEAIEPLTVEEKQKVRIGLATFDTTRCIPYAYGHECMVCEEHCPIPDKAIFFVETQWVDHQKQTQTIKQPRVDATRCIGCGICEKVCPFRDRPAVRVTSANETRHPDNQPVLSDAGPY